MAACYGNDVTSPHVHNKTHHLSEQTINSMILVLVFQCSDVDGWVGDNTGRVNAVAEKPPRAFRKVSGTPYTPAAKLNATFV